MTDEEFERLFRDYQAAVYAWIVRIVRDRGAAEDLTIETFWRVYRTRDRFDGTRAFAPWVRRYATNCALNYLKQERSRPKERTAEAVCPPLGDDAIARDNIKTAFDKLPAKLRLTATLALVEELPYADIASALDISVAAVKSRVFRATRLLRKKLERMGITA